MLYIKIVFLNFLSFLVVNQSQLDISSKITHLLKLGNSKELSKEFADNVSLTINKVDNYYTKFQAGVYLSDFFRANKVVSVKQVQKKISQSSHSYLVYELKTNTTSFRVFIRLIIVDKEYKISEFRIE